MSTSSPDRIGERQHSMASTEFPAINPESLKGTIDEGEDPVDVARRCEAMGVYATWRKKTVLADRDIWRWSYQDGWVKT